MPPNARNMQQQNPASPRIIAKTFADHLAAFGFRPLLRTDENKIIGGPGAPIGIKITITDNAAVAQDLRLASTFDSRVQNLYGSASTPLRAWLHLEGMSLNVFDAGYPTESLALHQALEDRAEVKVTSNGLTQKFPLKGRIWEPWQYNDVRQAAAAAAVMIFGRTERPLWLEKPLAIDLEADTFEFDVATAINWAGTDVLATLWLYGSLAPKGTYGADVSHTNAAAANIPDDAGNAYTVASPLQMAQITAAWLSRTFTRR